MCVCVECMCVCRMYVCVSGEKTHKSRVNPFHTASYYYNDDDVIHSWTTYDLPWTTYDLAQMKQVFTFPSIYVVKYFNTLKTSLCM